MGAYVAQVDRVLAAGQGLFPASTGPGSVGAGEDYRQSWRGVAALDAHTNGGAADGKAENERGQAGATGVRQTAQSQAAAIAPATGSPAGVKLLVSSMDERLAAMQREIDTTKAQTGCSQQDCARSPPPTAPPPQPHPWEVRRHSGRWAVSAGSADSAAGCPTWAGWPPHR